jgi:hypothetical protein
MPSILPLSPAQGEGRLCYLHAAPIGRIAERWIDRTTRPAGCTEEAVPIG